MNILYHDKSHDNSHGSSYVFHGNQTPPAMRDKAVEALTHKWPVCDGKAMGIGKSITKAVYRFNAMFKTLW